MNESSKAGTAQKPPTVEDITAHIAGLTPDHVIPGKPGQQFGLSHLKFACPRCFVPGAVSGPGRFACTCGAILQIDGAR